MACVDGILHLKMVDFTAKAEAHIKETGTEQRLGSRWACW
jgi:hypothetical protein